MGRAVEVTRIRGAFGCALTVDVEEWYHNCLVPSYVQPRLRPELPVELERLLPELLGVLAEAGCRATFFVLGEVAERLPRRVRELARAGHEVASHGFHHLRACERPAAEFARDIRRSKALLEDLLGERVRGFRAPEWSLRSLRSPLRQLPVFTCGGAARIPAGSWTGRLVDPARLVAAAERHLRRGGLPVAVAHPWEISDRPTPGPLSGLARFVHETGRAGYLPKFRHVLAGLPWRTLAEAAGLREAAAAEHPSPPVGEVFLPEPATAAGAFAMR